MYSGANAALYQIVGPNNFAAYNLSVAIDNNGDPTEATIDPYVAQDPATGYYPKSLKTGLSGQDNNLDASRTNYLTLSSTQKISMEVQMGDYVAVTNNDPNSANYGQTLYGVVGDSSGTIPHLGEMSHHFALEVFGANSGITKTGVDVLNKVNIMIAHGSVNTTNDGEINPTYTLDLNNDGVVPPTQ
ncbi:hypothetical protein GCM10027566_14620 [Arachidicoccus ginsenosidivorans]|uniref:Uncharacterized protein n=1 Tax=Arachidicoccus ginsenosidivorans TaxID=496057 RepID=A0A5B8VHJ2_9BACT|nr:hypothetical protein [Arachidicoccus ginsenosidivorans]QEC71057.1 hypothetical protein FSB73_04545 [Arachidicoccus ginsenosidivorans]